MKAKFTSPSRERVEELAPELRNQGYGFNENLALRLVVENGKLWLVKRISQHAGDISRARKLEFLVQSLGDGLVNVANVQPLTEDDIMNIKELSFVKLPNDVSSHNAVLVRLGQDYSKEELPLQDLDAAVAGELVFSVWVRRWDTHSFNRAYNRDNIPVFFDLQVSLNGTLGEDFRDIVKFFPDNGGAAGAWRVKETKISPTTSMYRKDPTPNHTHDICNIGKFKQATWGIAHRIISNHRNLRTLAETAGFTGTDADNLVTYLEETKRTLSEDVKKC